MRGSSGDEEGDGGGPFGGYRRGWGESVGEIGVSKGVGCGGCDVEYGRGEEGEKRIDCCCE